VSQRLAKHPELPNVIALVEGDEVQEAPEFALEPCGRRARQELGPGVRQGLLDAAALLQQCLPERCDVPGVRGVPDRG